MDAETKKNIKDLQVACKIINPILKLAGEDCVLTLLVETHAEKQHREAMKAKEAFKDCEPYRPSDDKTTMAGILKKGLQSQTDALNQWCEEEGVELKAEVKFIEGRNKVGEPNMSEHIGKYCIFDGNLWGLIASVWDGGFRILTKCEGEDVVYFRTFEEVQIL